MNLPFDLGNKTAVIVTMHGKQRVIGPQLAAMGLQWITTPDIDTDRFGTFTRDVARMGSQIETVTAKARAGLEVAPLADFGVASEGSFGPHPEIPFVSAGLEMVALIERHTGDTLIGRDLSVETNYAQAEVRSQHEVEAFAARILFPLHAVVVMETRNGPVVAKGISEADELRRCVAELITRTGSAWLETDMRAHQNPTRMCAIERASQDLIRRLQARCPDCGYPDWTPKFDDGRPCSWCGGPTLEVWRQVVRCARCGKRSEHFIEPERMAQPAACPSCNP